MDEQPIDTPMKENDEIIAMVVTSKSRPLEKTNEFKIQIPKSKI